MSYQYDTVDLALSTLRIGVESTTIAAVVGIPVGAGLGLGRFRGRRGVVGVFNAGLRVPPVALGHALWILMWPSSQWGGGPLAGLGCLYTLEAVILAQTLLALPVVVALTSAAVQAVPGGLLSQARAFGASRGDVTWLALREARVAVIAALIAAFGTTVASVGAVLVVGNGRNAATLPSAALTVWNQGFYGEAVAYGSIMLGIFLVIAAALTTVQHGHRPRWLPVRS